MIKSIELRIGNWVLEAGDPSTIYHLERGGISSYRINDIVYNRQTGCTVNGGEDRLQPIPLTAEILEKAGFEYRELSKDWPTYPIYGIKNCTLIKQGDDFFLNGYHNDIEIKYVHQLQNLYSALTGEELSITL